MMITNAQLSTWTEQQDMGFTRAHDTMKAQLVKHVTDGLSMETTVQFAQEIARYEGHLQICQRIDMMLLAGAEIMQIVMTLNDDMLSEYTDPRDVIGIARRDGKRAMVRKLNEQVRFGA